MPNSLERLEESATQLFSRAWYSSVSAAEICRNAGLSNGIFYHYFKDKDELIMHLLDKTIKKIGEALLEISGASKHERLMSMIQILFNFAEDNKELVKVFREGQYRFIAYERKLVDLYKKELSIIIERPVTTAEYLYVFGGLRFASIRSAFHGKAVSIVALAEMMEHGIFKNQTINTAKIFDIHANLQPVQLSGSGRERLLSAGKELFGRGNFDDVNIYQITEHAGYSVGAFYKHFPSKEAFFAELIEQSGREIRHFISANLTSGLNRLEREVQGIFLFGSFLGIDPSCYNIVREGEFIIPEKVQEYYAAFEEAYARQQDTGIDPAATESDPLFESTAVEYLLGIAHYYGIELVFDEHIRNGREVLESMAKLLSGGFEGGL